MITHADDGPEFEPDDPLAVILRPPSDLLGPPAGRYEAIRRGAARRRLLRASLGAGLACAVAVLVALPLRAAQSEGPASPAVPLAPPPASSPSTVPEPAPSQRNESPRPSASDPTGRTPSTSAPRTVPTPRGPARSSAPTRRPSATPTSVSVEPSAARTGVGPTPSSAVRR
ncbi:MULTISPECIES: hypothetical protein [unclassified Streptomyces]|uniref:hypothetical protein n=1 Tax=unclassified Streptomyces TaxID=2593676 RepID=UPI00225B5008|nr:MULTISPECIES: hypothetical protein [unclassified Streptomyces]MCX5279435.1 hypothetical protein [Streptomyces sp. NBC_00198]WSD77268.1 hypothetical protein OHB33_13540 [Streptomyces sp. NBC_01558]